jgi:hypothetical protein
VNTLLLSYDQCLSAAQIKSWFSRRAKIMPVKLKKYLDQKEKGESDAVDPNKEYEVTTVEIVRQIMCKK